MLIITYLNCGLKNTSWKLIIIYLILVGLDLLTTYIGTPDFKYEGNLIIRYLDLSWTLLITAAFGGSIILLFLFLTTLGYLTVKKRSCKKTSFNTIPIIAFYYHLFYSAFAVPNNILSSIYIHRSTHFEWLSTYYIQIVYLLHPIFYPLIMLIFFCVSLAYSIVKIKKIIPN